MHYFTIPEFDNAMEEVFFQFKTSLRKNILQYEPVSTSPG
jgi:hypothetical protein